MDLTWRALSCWNRLGSSDATVDKDTLYNFVFTDLCPQFGEHFVYTFTIRILQERYKGRWCYKMIIYIGDLKGMDCTGLNKFQNSKICLKVKEKI